MERTLILIRHAKSSWADTTQSDFDRPLNERGEKEATEMGEKLKERQILPDLMICSKAKRTKQTAKRLARILNCDADAILKQEKLYHCIPSVFEDVIFEVPDTVKTLVVVGHNPGITEFVNELAGQLIIDNMPTCGIIAFRFEAEGWNQIALATKRIIFFDYPGKEA